MNAVRIFKKYIKIKFGISRCATLVIKIKTEGGR